MYYNLKAHVKGRIFCIIKVILHGFRINIIGISINRYFYEYNVDDKNAIKEYHRGRAVRSIIILDS